MCGLLASPPAHRHADRGEVGEPDGRGGLLRRAADPADARLVRLQLTERARGLQGVIEAERDALARRATATLTSAEREHLRTALIKIIAQFADDPGVDGPSGVDGIR